MYHYQPANDAADRLFHLQHQLPNQPTQYRRQRLHADLHTNCRHPGRQQWHIHATLRGQSVGAGTAGQPVSRAGMGAFSAQPGSLDDGHPGRSGNRTELLDNVSAGDGTALLPTGLAVDRDL